MCAEGGFTRPVDPGAVPAVTNYLSAVGAIGLTAYFALLDIGQPQPGETVLVTGAAGAVGSLVGQIAKMKGCRTIGIAGGKAKCDRLTGDYGYDAAIDYRGKSPDQLAHAIREAAPNGVDVHFENVGGDILDAALLSLNPGGRVVLCGLISEYNSQPRGARNLWQLIVQGARMQGFILTHYIPAFRRGDPRSRRLGARRPAARRRACRRRHRQRAPRLPSPVRRQQRRQDDPADRRVIRGRSA